MPAPQMRRPKEKEPVYKKAIEAYSVFDMGTTGILGWKLLRVRDELMARLERYCAEHGLKMSTVAAEAIAAYLKRRGA